MLILLSFACQQKQLQEAVACNDLWDWSSNWYAKAVMQLGILWVGQKIVWDSKTSTNFCSKIMVFSKKKVFTIMQKFVGHAMHDLHALTARQ